MIVFITAPELARGYTVTNGNSAFLDLNQKRPRLAEARHSTRPHGVAFSGTPAFLGDLQTVMQP
jgi:hypothetical protein